MIAHTVLTQRHRWLEESTNVLPKEEEFYTIVIDKNFIGLTFFSKIKI